MRIVRRGAAYGLRLLPAPLYAHLLPREVIGLCYHVVSDRPLPHVAPLFAFKSVAQFEADLRWLKRNYHVVSYAELMDARERGTRLAPHSVFLSFDDGYAECFSVVRPLLLEHGLPCTFFLPTGALDNRRALAFNQVALCLHALGEMAAGDARAVLEEMGTLAGRPLADVAALAEWLRPGLHTPNAPATDALHRLLRLTGVDVEAFLRTEPYLTTAQVRRMAAEGFTFGGHSRLHWRLGAIADAALVEAEIVESCREVAALVGASRVAFAFPYDGIGVDRGLLADVVRRHPFIDPVFGSGALAREPNLVLNRMLVDAPPAMGGQWSNLPGVFRGAYLDEMMRAVRRRVMGGAAPAPR